MIFLTKPMPLAEWRAFQEWFAEMHMLLGAPINMALFKRREGMTDDALIAISGVSQSKLEAESPAGWKEAQALSGPGWKLLVGHADVAERLGVPISE